MIVMNVGKGKSDGMSCGLGENELKQINDRMNDRIGDVGIPIDLFNHNIVTSYEHFFI